MDYLTETRTVASAVSNTFTLTPNDRRTIFVLDDNGLHLSGTYTITTDDTHARTGDQIVIIFGRSGNLTMNVPSNFKITFCGGLRTSFNYADVGYSSETNAFDLYFDGTNWLNTLDLG